MTTAATSLLGLALPVTGELAGTWGDTVNDSITSLLDTAVAGTTTLSTDGDVTLTTTAQVANQARQAILLCSGARTALRTITAPAQSKIYTVINATTGGYSVKLVGAGPTTGVTVVAGESALVAWNGSDFIKISNTGGAASFTNVTVSGTTTLSGLTASTALALNASKEVVSVTNTGTGNNVLAGSPTLTGTVNAAAVTMSSDLTLSGGTANGVLYLNGSKVATSGSALTFDGATLKVTGSSGARYVTLNAPTNGGSLTFEAGGTAFADIGSSTAIFGTGSATDFLISTRSGYPLIFGANNAEGMRLTSTSLYTASGINVGIGTSSPANKLQVVASSSGTNDLLTISRFDRGSSGTAANGLGGRLEFSSQDNAGSQRTAAFLNWGLSSVASGSPTGFLSLSTRGTDPALYIDNSGNLGIGTSSPAYKLDVSGYIRGLVNTSSVGNTSSMQLTQNGTGDAAISFLIGSTTEWLLGVDNSASDAFKISNITGGGDFTSTGIVLDTSGNLGLGGTNDMVGLAVQTPSYTTAYAADLGSNASVAGYGSQLQVVSPSDSSTVSGISLFTRTTGRSRWDILNVWTGTYLGDLVFRRRNGGTSTAEAMRIDSSGNLLVGTTSPNGKVTFSAGANSNGLFVDNDTYDYQTLSLWNKAGANDNLFARFFTEGTITLRGSIDYNRAGGLTRYNTTSDYRAKDIIGLVQNTGATIDALKVYEGVMKGATQARPMMIAHEAQAVVPFCVSGVKDEINEDGSPKYQQMDHASLVPLLIAELQSLRARVAQLELKGA